MDIGGVGAAPDYHVGVNEVALALNGDVLDRCLPLGVVVGVRGDVNGDAFLVERHTRERHIALPADEIAHRPPRRVHDGEKVAVCVAPHDALAAGGLELSVVHGPPLGRDHHIGVIKRPRDGVALGISDADVNAVLDGAVD